MNNNSEKIPIELFCLIRNNSVIDIDVDNQTEKDNSIIQYVGEL
jgi:hypothetical protein